jgi:SulP family sulfate permease
VALPLVLVVLLFLRPVLALFPKAALGAIVIYAALRLIDLAEFRRLLAFRGSEFRLALVTLAGVLLTDLLVGVGLAVGLSVMDLFFRLLRPHDDVMDPVPSLAGLVVYRFDAPLCFANAEHFRRRALEVIDAAGSEAAWFVLNAEAIVEIDITPPMCWTNFAASWPPGASCWPWPG